MLSHQCIAAILGRYPGVSPWDSCLQPLTCHAAIYYQDINALSWFFVMQVQCFRPVRDWQKATMPFSHVGPCLEARLAINFSRFSTAVQSPVTSA